MSNLRRSLARRTFLHGSFLIFAANQLAFAQFPPGRFFHDDFEDGNLIDAKPVRWGRGLWNGATESIIDGSATIANSRGSSVLTTRTDNNGTFLGYGDITIQTQVRVVDPAVESTFAGIAARSPDPRSYFTGISTSGNFVISRTASDLSVINMGLVETGLDVTTHDVRLRFDLKGSEIRAWAWDANLPMPTAPLLSVTDSSLSFGTIGMIAFSDGTPGSVAFRWFEVTAVQPIPEPNSFLLVAIGAPLLLTCRPGNWFRASSDPNSTTRKTGSSTTRFRSTADTC